MHLQEIGGGRTDRKAEDNKLKCTEKRAAVCQREYIKKKTNKHAEKPEREDQ